MQLNENKAYCQIYYILSDQPDSCGKCGGRLDLVGIKVIEGERVFVSE